MAVGSFQKIQINSNSSKQIQNSNQKSEASWAGKFPPRTQVDQGVYPSVDLPPSGRPAPFPRADMKGDDFVTQSWLWLTLESSDGSNWVEILYKQPYAQT